MKRAIAAKVLLTSLAVVLMVSASAQAGLLADFNAAGTGDTMTQANDKNNVTYDDIATATTPTVWSSYRKNAATVPPWQIGGDQLYNNLCANQSNNAADAVFKVDLSNPTDGKVWAIQFTVVAGGRDASSSGLQDFDVLLGQDDGDNTTEQVVQIKGGGQVGQSGVVVNDEWNHVVSQGWLWQTQADGNVVTAPFHHGTCGTDGALKDLSSYDLLSFQVQSNSKAGNATIIDDVNLVEVKPVGDFDSDGDWDTADVDALTALGDLTAGVNFLPVPHPNEIYDISCDMMDDTAADDTTIESADLNMWLYWSARGNSAYGVGGTAYYTAYKASDTDLDRDVDITDFNRIPTNFSPVANPANVFSMGDSNGDSKIDITDFNQLVIDFAPAGYGEEVPPGIVALGALGAAAGTIDLIVDLVTGDVSLDVASGGVSINSFQVVSVDLGLTVDGMNPPPNVLAVSFGSNTQFYAEGSMSDTLLAGGMYSLGDIYDILKGKTDLTFEYASTTLGTVDGVVTYVPEPATMALLGLGGLVVMIRRRRVA